MKKALLTVIGIVALFLIWFYKIESSDAYKFKDATNSFLKHPEKSVYIKDIFPQKWDTVCPLNMETVYPGSVEKLENYMDAQYNNLIPDTFAYNFGYGLIFLDNKKPVKAVKIKNAGFKYENKVYVFDAIHDIKCFKRPDALITVKAKENYYSVSVGEN